MNSLSGQVYNRLIEALMENQAAADDMRHICDRYELASRRFCKLLEMPYPPDAAKKAA